jgi:uncharacterized membrane protein YgcG
MNPHLGFPRRPKTPDASVADRTPPPDADFAERLMASIEREPSPTPTRNFLSAVRARSVGDAAAALWVAWHLGTVRGWRIAPGVRARSIALVLAVACVMATGSLAAAAALRVAAEPVVNMFQSGIDEQGPVENASPDVDQQRQLHQSDQPGVNEPGRSNGQSDQPGANQPGNAGQSDQPGVNQPGSGNAGQFQSSGENTSTAGSGSGGSSGASGSNQDGNSNH